MLKTKSRFDVSTLLLPAAGALLLLAMWAISSASWSQNLPSPAKTWEVSRPYVVAPFEKRGELDQGVARFAWYSLVLVAKGYALALLLGAPLGFILGWSKLFAKSFDPIIQVLRPVSPLAWLPIGLLVFQAANPAAIWTIFICSIWPMIINTAVGVQRVPDDYMNVARVLNLSEWKVMTRILLPAVLPYMLTGVRLAVGTAWLVIVAAEMLTGGVGIGFWLWDEWNNLKVDHILIAIFVIGVVGLVLESALVAVAKRFTYADV